MADLTSFKNTGIEGMKFAIVGISGIGVNFLILSLAIYVFSLSDPVAIALGILFSMSSNYLLNRIWTFSSDNNMGGEYVNYVLLNLLGSFIQYVVALSLELYFERIGFPGLDLLLFVVPSIYIASFVGILLGFVSNFLFSKYFVFN